MNISSLIYPRAIIRPSLSDLITVTRFHSHTIISPKNQLLPRASRRISAARRGFAVFDARESPAYARRSRTKMRNSTGLSQKRGKRNRSNNIPYYDVTRDTESRVSRYTNALPALTSVTSLMHLHYLHTRVCSTSIYMLRSAITY